MTEQVAYLDSTTHDFAGAVKDEFMAALMYLMGDWIEKKDRDVKAVGDAASGLISRLNDFNNSGERIETVVGNLETKLPSTDPTNAYYYLKVDSDGNVIAQEPINSLGDGDFSGDANDIPNAQTIQDLIYMINGWTEDSLNSRIDEVSAENDNFKNYDIIKGNTITGQATAQGYTITPVTYVADTNLIETVDVILVDVPDYDFKEYIKVKPYGETSQ